MDNTFKTLQKPCTFLQCYYSYHQSRMQLLSYSCLAYIPGWVQSYVRARTFQFTDPFTLDEKAVFFVKSGNSFNWRDITGKTIGFLDGWVFDEFCIGRDPEIQVSRFQLV